MDRGTGMGTGTGTRWVLDPRQDTCSRAVPRGPVPAVECPQGGHVVCSLTCWPQISGLPGAQQHLVQLASATHVTPPSMQLTHIGRLRACLPLTVRCTTNPSPTQSHSFTQLWKTWNQIFSFHSRGISLRIMQKLVVLIIIVIYGYSQCFRVFPRTSGNEINPKWKGHTVEQLVDLRQYTIFRTKYLSHLPNSPSDFCRIKFCLPAESTLSKGWNNNERPHK